MKRLLFILLLAHATAVMAADVVYFQLHNLAKSAATNRTCLIIPSDLEDSTGLPIFDRIKTNSGPTGSFAVSNMLVGNYTIEVQGPPATTKLDFYVDSSNAVQYAHLNRIVPAPSAAPSQYYTKPQVDALVGGAGAVAVDTGLTASTNGRLTTVAIDTNRVKSIERRVYITDGDSVTAGDSWFPIFLTNSVFAAQGATISSTNFAIASDGVGFGHPDNLSSMSYRALSSVVVAANGTATATLGSAFNSDIRRFVIRSASVPGLTRIYTITPTGQPFTTFTFQTTGVAAQTINDARLEFGAVSRYASFIRPIVTNAVGQGYVPHVIFFLGLNDSGAVYQTGDNSGLTNYWAPAYSNLLSCARADGARISVLTLHRQSSIWNSLSASARYLQNDWIRTANVGGRPMYDTLVDWEAAVPNPFDTRFFTDGLHVTSLGKRAIAQAVDTALLAGDSGAARMTMNSEMAEAKAYFSTKTPEGVYSLPRGTLVIVTATNGNPAVIWVKKSATGATGWEPLITSGTASNITDGTILKSKLETPVQNVVNNAVTNGSSITAESLTVDGQTPLVISNGVTTARILWGDLSLKPDGSMFGIGWQFHANGDIATGGKFHGDASTASNLNASAISSGTVSVDRIADGSIPTNKLDAATLSLIANAGKTNVSDFSTTNLTVHGAMNVAGLNTPTIIVSNWPAGFIHPTNIASGVGLTALVTLYSVGSGGTGVITNSIAITNGLIVSWSGWLNEVSPGGGETCSLWSTPILQQQTTDNERWQLDTGMDQCVRNTASGVSSVCKVRLKLQSIDSGSTNITVQLRSAANGGGTQYGADATASLPGSSTDWVDFTFASGVSIPANTDFYIYVPSTGSANYRWEMDYNHAGGVGYQDTTYCAYRSGEARTLDDMCFEVHITQ